MLQHLSFNARWRAARVFARAAATAPFDDEPLTEEDRAAIRRGREEHARGERAG